MSRIFFLIIPLLFSTLPFAFANHIPGQDDVFTWREFDNHPTNSVYCTFDGITPFGDSIAWQCEGDTFGGTVRQGALLIMKVFEKADIQNVGGSNVFTWDFDYTCTSAPCSQIFMGIMDGVYDYQGLSEPGGFPPNSEYDDNTSTPWGAGGTTIYLGQSSSDLDNIFGAGSLITSGATTPQINTATPLTGSGTISATVTNSLWLESTESHFTVFLVLLEGLTAESNHYVEPGFFSITLTPSGTMTWNFPETTDEANDWNDAASSVYQQNGTESDHGYVFSFDPTVPDPPTNLFATEGLSSITLQWTAPTFTGFSPITGYKIERETPVGNGFTTLIPNTGNTDTTYVDTSVVLSNEYNYRVSALNTYGSSLPSNESVDGAGDEDLNPSLSCPGLTSAFELFLPVVTQNSISACWDTFNTGSANVTGYQINYTSPWGDPLTVSVNDTESTLRTYKLTGLQPSTQYSVRINAWLDNATSFLTNIANATTGGGGLDIGNWTFTGEKNADSFKIKFVREDINSTALNLYIDYDNSYDLQCDFAYRFAQTNQTYSSISGVYKNDQENRATFTFVGVDNEVIRVICSDDGLSITESRYVITQTNFPFLQQLENFKTGEYGTTGEFGAIDLITLVVVILAMIGFNRVNAAVGVVFAAMLIGALGVLGIITYQAVIAAAFAVFILLAVLGHNKDDVAD